MAARRAPVTSILSGFSEKYGPTMSLSVLLLFADLLVP
jgi:hypothetical protein